MTVGICKYCGQEQELILSHLIPRCFYQFDKFGSVVGVDAKKLKLDKNTNFQNGVKMPLLCESCDNEFGKLDGYVNKVLNIEIPKMKEFGYVDGSKCWRLSADKFDIPKIRKFFISLVWRLSVSNINPFPLGKYSDIALKILKGEQPDDEKLFLPLIYKRSTGGSVDNFTVVYRKKYLGKWTCNIRFPGYEVIVIINTENSNDKQLMDQHKKQFTKKEILIVELDRTTPVDYHLAKTLMASRGTKKTTTS